MIPLIWAAAGVVLIAAELLVGEFVLLMLGVAALAAAGASGLGLPFGSDAAVFTVVAVALVLLARPALARRVRPDEVNTGTRALLGARAEVVDAVDDAGGTVRLRGSTWTARALHGGVVLEQGAAVLVVAIDGATAVVTRQ